MLVRFVESGRERGGGNGDGDYVVGALEVEGSGKSKGCFERIEFVFEGLNGAE